MRKLIFSNLVDAILNRVGGIVSNMLLRRLAMHVAQSEAAELASAEEQLRMLQDRGHTAAAKRLETYLREAEGDDPSFAIGTSVARQLIADDYAIDSPEMRGEPASNSKAKAKLGRPPKQPASTD